LAIPWQNIQETGDDAVLARQVMVMVMVMVMVIAVAGVR
jgi:hypothetical protein